jgi:hypothetical protein
MFIFFTVVLKMPKAQEFLKGFKLIPHTIFGGYELIKATASHETIKRYQEYQYSITLVFMGDANYTNQNYKDLFNAVMEEIRREPIIYGVRNPYRCTIEPPSRGDITGVLEGPITFKLIGHSYRI